MSGYDDLGSLSWHDLHVAAEQYRRERDELAAQIAAEHGETPITEEWLRANGWHEWEDSEDELYRGTLFLPCGEWLGWARRLVWLLGHVEAVRMHEDREQVSESVSLLGWPASKSTRATRGQLLALLRSMGVRQ